MVANSFFQILRLPEEILIAVFDFLDFQTLRDTVTVCRHFNELSEPFLYHSIYILNGWQASALSVSLVANKRRASWIRSLLVSTKFGEDKGLNKLPPCISLMRNLQELRLETPDCNTKTEDERISWIDLQNKYERIFECASSLVPKGERFIPNLKNCTLHFVDDQKEIYSMTKYPMLFLHPNLKSLTICCASTDFPHKLLVPFQNDPSLVKSTALEYLHLEECDICSPSLAILLSFPRALKSLKISEGVRYDGMFRNRSSRIHGNVTPEPFVEAIAKHCRESLEYLSLSLGYFRHGGQHIDQFNQHLNLTAFEGIKHLELDLRTSHLVRPRPCDHATWRRLPPNLEKLRIFGVPLGQRSPFQGMGRVLFPLDHCFAKDKAKHGVRNLSTLIFSYEYYHEDDEMPYLSISDDGDSVEEVSQITIAQHRLVGECNNRLGMYKKAGVNLQIEMVVLPKGFIPPYLYREDSPKKFLLWESGRASCRRCNNRFKEPQHPKTWIATREASFELYSTDKINISDFCQNCQAASSSRSDWRNANTTVD